MKSIHADFTAWLQSTAFEMPYSPHTIRLYSKVCGDFDAFCQNELIDLCAEFATPHVRKFTGTSATGKPYARSTINSRLVALELIFTYLQEINECNENPVVYYRDAKVRKRGE